MGADPRAADRLALAGAAGCLLALVAIALSPPSAWRAWLGVSFLWSTGPIGAVALLMIMRLTPGDWSEELGPFMEAGALLLPICALLLLPVLLQMKAIYGWVGSHEATSFRAAYLSEPLFVLRTALWFAFLMALAFLLVVRRVRAAAVAGVGLTLFPLLGTLVAVDWLLSLDKDYASSGFGLYVICIQMMTALALAIAALLVSGRPVQRPGIMGGLLLCFLLLWSYFAFMHYFITWSDNLPPGVRWYQRRGGDGWSIVMWLVAASRLCPTVLLFFETVRHSRRALLALALAVAAGTVLEAAWLTFPVPRSLPQARPLDIAIYALASLAIGALMTGVFPRALAWRERRPAS